MDGILIVFDGIDGAGKTTQVQLLGDVLAAIGEKVTLSKEPTNGQFGRLLRQSAQSGRLSLDEELRLFIADRKEHVANVVHPALDRGEVVILDRYYYSTMAYQGQRGADIGAVFSQMREIAPTPDVTFLVDIDAHLGLHRISKSRGEIPNEFEQAEALSEIRRLFLGMPSRMPEIAVVDGSQSIHAVYAGIVQQLLDGVLKAKRCAKSYDCDVFYCAARIAGECRWANIYRDLKMANLAVV